MHHAHTSQLPETVDLQAHLAAVIGQAEAGEWATAREQLQRLIHCNAQRDDLHHLMGLLCLQLDDVEAAMRSYTAALTLQPAVAHYHHDLGVALVHGRRWQAASEALRQAWRLDPVAFDTREAVVDCQYELHCEDAQRRKQEWNLGAALRHARTAVALRPEFPLGHTLLGAIEYELGEYGQSARSHASANTLAGGSSTPSEALYCHSQSRLLHGRHSAPESRSVCVGLSQRDFAELYQHLMEHAQLPDENLFQRHPLADPLWVDGELAEDAFTQALTEARNGNVPLARDTLVKWLLSPTPTPWTLAHDEHARLCFRAIPGATHDNMAKAGLLLELVFKCDHVPTRQCAGLALLEGLRDMAAQAQCLSAIVDQHMHHKLAQLEPKSPNSSRRISCVVFGTCITRGLVYLLNLSEEFRRRFALRPYITHMNQPLMADFAVADDVIESCELLLHMPTVWADWGNDDYYGQLLGRFASAVPRITFPYPVFHALWPYHCHDKRNQDSSLKNAQGEQAHFPYGDSYVLGLMKKYRAERADQIAARYAAWDIPSQFDIDGLMRHSLEQQRAKEQVTDVKIIDHAQEHFRSQRLFLTMNHVGNASLIHMANQVLRMLELPTLHEKTGARLQELTVPQVPIHPSILKYYGITYLNSDSRYLVDAHRMLTFEEYTEQYVLFQ